MSCTGFHTDVLYCEYLLHVPSDWKPDVSHLNLLSATTQISYSKSVGVARYAHFGFPFDVQLLCRDDSPRMPTLYIKVMSVDGEDRHALEGYGNVVLSATPGSSVLEIKTWRPLFPHTSQLKTFFLGGSPELLDLKYNETEVCVV